MKDIQSVELNKKKILIKMNSGAEIKLSDFKNAVEV